MLNSIVLEITMGLVFIYLLYSLLVTIIGEVLSTKLGIRPRMLRIAIERMLNDGYYSKKEKQWHKRWQGWLRRDFLYEPPEFRSSFAGRFYYYPSIKYLSRVEEQYNALFSSTKPSYLTPDYFADTLINLLKERGVGATDMDRVGFVLQFNPYAVQPKTLQNLRNFFTQSYGDKEVFHTILRNWFIETMDRTNGWYKRKLRLILFWLGFGIALGFNVDTISMAKTMAGNNDVRHMMVQMSVEASDPNSPVAKAIARDAALRQENDSLLSEGYRQLKNELTRGSMALGLGWSGVRAERLFIAGGYYFPLYRQLNPFRYQFWGIIITAFALSLGAPFWFDLLKRLVEIRNAGTRPPDEKPAAISGAGNMPAPVAAKVPASPALKVAPPLAGDRADAFIMEYSQPLLAVPGVKSVFKIRASGGQSAVQVNTVDVASKNQAESIIRQLPDQSPLSILVEITGVPESHAVTLQAGEILNATLKNGFGALGCIVTHSKTGARHLLSCWHVLKGNRQYDLDDAFTTILDHRSGQIGTRWAGGIFDCFDYSLAELAISRSAEDNQRLFSALNFAGPVDYRELTGADYLNRIPVIYFDALNGKPRTGQLYTDAPVVQIHYHDKVREVRDLLILRRAENDSTTISQGGNSGSVIFDTDGKAIGLLVGGDNKFTYAMKIIHFFSIHPEMQILNT